MVSIKLSILTASLGKAYDINTVNFGLGIDVVGAWQKQKPFTEKRDIYWSKATCYK